MAMGSVQQVKDPWFEAHQKTSFSGNVKSYSVNGLCGRQSIFSDCLSPFKSVHFSPFKYNGFSHLFLPKNVLQNTLIFVGGCSVY